MSPNMTDIHCLIVPMLPQSLQPGHFSLTCDSTSLAPKQLSCKAGEGWVAQHQSWACLRISYHHECELWQWAFALMPVSRCLAVSTVVPMTQFVLPSSASNRFPSLIFSPFSSPLHSPSSPSPLPHLLLLCFFSPHLVLENEH